MKIAITGGTGFVGRHLEQEPLRQGHQVILITRRIDLRGPAILHSSRVGFTISDLSHTSNLRRCMQ